MSNLDIYLRECDKDEWLASLDPLHRRKILYLMKLARVDTHRQVVVSLDKITKEIAFSE